MEGGILNEEVLSKCVQLIVDPSMLLRDTTN